MATKKETPVKKEVKTAPVKAKTEKVEAIVEAKPRDTRGTLSVSMFALTGKEAGTFDLPKSIFGAQVNKDLLAQALRVYLNNLKGHHSNTKTRGEVEGSTRKIYRQKGTGRARHGAVRAPIFVGGGIALGPKSRKGALDLPKKMKIAALISALSQKTLDKTIFAVSGLEKASGKTSEIAKFAKNMNTKNLVIVADKVIENVERATGNLKNVSFLSADQLNALEVIRAQSVLFTKEAVEALEKRILKQESNESVATKESKAEKEDK